MKPLAKSSNRDSSAEDECPTNDFSPGNPSGQCWGDGHYKCKECKFYREDFKRLGQDYIDFVHREQGQIQIFSL